MTKFSYGKKPSEGETAGKAAPALPTLKWGTGKSSFLDKIRKDAPAPAPAPATPTKSSENSTKTDISTESKPSSKEKEEENIVLSVRILHWA